MYILLTKSTKVNHLGIKLSLINKVVSDKQQLMSEREKEKENAR